MTYKEIEDKYLYKFCDIGFGPIYVCRLQKEQNRWNDNIYIHFIYCNGREDRCFADNIFVSKDGINFEYNEVGAPSDFNIKFCPPNVKYLYNLISRLFEDKPNDPLPVKMLEEQ